MSTNQGGGATRHYFRAFDFWIRVPRVVFDAALDVEIWAQNIYRRRRGLGKL